MILYHGSNANFDVFDLTFTKRGKDFGRGIYLTTSKKQALKWAIRFNKGYIYECELNDSLLEERNDLKIKALLEYNTEWLDFIVSCRIKGYEPQYDIVYDRMADNTYKNLSELLIRYYNDVINPQVVISKVRWKNKEFDQYYFKTDKALKYLRIISKEEVYR